MNKKIEIIIQELYAQNEEFKKYDKELRNIIAKVLESKPDVIINQELRQQIIDQLLNKEKLIDKIMDFTFKPVYAGLGMVVILIIATLFLTNIDSHNGDNLTMIGDNAFGSLALQEQNINKSIEPRSELSVGMGGGGEMFATDVSSVEQAIYPYYTQYVYKYVGDEFDLTDQKLKVYQRKPGLGKDIYGSKILGDIDIVDLSLFKNAKIENIQLTQDNEYMISLDFNRGHISMNRDYRSWVMPDNMLKIEDIPEDEEIIKISNDFLKKYKINLNNYGEPILNKYWLDYPEYEVMSRPLFSQEIQIVYPLIIDGNVVKDQGGNEYGLNVSVDVFQNKVVGIYDLAPQKYDVSMYDAITDKQEVLDIVERGGIYGGYYGPQDNVNTIIGLVGDPEFTLMRHYRYDNNNEYEMYVPALLFPITGWETEKTGYVKNIIVPLVKDLINYDPPVLYYKGVPEPMPMIDGDVTNTGTDE